MSKTVEDGILLDPLAHPELLSALMRISLQETLELIFSGSTSHTLLVLQSAREERKDGKFCTHWELQVEKVLGEGVKEIKTFGLMLNVKMEKETCLEHSSELAPQS